MKIDKHVRCANGRAAVGARRVGGGGWMMTALSLHMTTCTLDLTHL
jgi:hypothetical protein